MTNYRMRFLAMEDEDDSDFDDRSLQQWRRQKMRLEQVHRNALIPRDKVNRGSQGHVTSTESEAKPIHEAEGVDKAANVVEPISLDIVTTAPTTPDNYIKEDSLSGCTLDEEQCTILSSPTLGPSPRETTGHHKRGRSSSRKMFHDKGQTSLYQFSATTHRPLSDSLKAQKSNSSQTGPAKGNMSSEGSDDSAVQPSMAGRASKGYSRPSPSAGTSGAQGGKKVRSSAAQGAKKVSTSAAQGGKKTSRRECPFYKRVPGMLLVHAW